MADNAPTSAHDKGSNRDPHACANLALSILQQRDHTQHTLNLAVMALRGATITQLLQADQTQTQEATG